MALGIYRLAHRVCHGTRYRINHRHRIGAVEADVACGLTEAGEHALAGLPLAMSHAPAYLTELRARTFLLAPAIAYRPRIQ